MKKILLTAALAAMAVAPASAQVAEDHIGHLFSNMSDDGHYAAEDINGALVLFDRWTGDSWYFKNDDDDHVAVFGNGHCISNNGIASGFDSEVPCYWKDGFKFTLPLWEGAGTGFGSGNAITPDGKYICGYVGTGANFGGDGLMTRPAVWSQKDDGTWVVDSLPYPKKDFTGRAPQYIILNQISSDGNTIVGQLRDFTGFYNCPLIYKKGADGTWSYTLIGEGLIWYADKIKNLPAEPTDPSSQIPVPASYFTAADTVAYNQAVETYTDAYNQCIAGELPWDSLPQYPDYWMFISENHDQWAADSAHYQDLVAKYYEDFQTYRDSLDAATTGNSFVFNEYRLSSNGKLVGATMTVTDSTTQDYFGNYGTAYYPTIIDISGEKPVIKVMEEAKNGYTTAIDNEGNLIVCDPITEYVRNAQVIKAGETTPVKFYDYINARNEMAGIFLKKNYSFNVPVYNEDEGEGGGDWGWGDDDEGGVYANKKGLNFTAKDYTIVSDSLITGTVYANNDFTIFGSFMQEMYSDPDNTTINRTWFIDLNENAQSGIKGVKKAEEADGTVIGHEYYNINGQRISAAPAKGIYLEKRITTNGFTTIKHVK